MRVGNFCAYFLKVPKIGDLKSFTLSCNARILRRQKSQRSQNTNFIPKQAKF